MKAYITIGLPASGKTTWAKEFCKTNNVVRVNNDDIRELIYEKEGHRNWTGEVEKQVRWIRKAKIVEAAGHNMSVVVDNTHLNPKTLQQIKDFCVDVGFEVELVDFRHVPLEECIRRDSLREAKVGEKVIRDMYDKFMKTPIDRDLPKWEPNRLYNCIIVDIDGTLAQMKDRGPYDEHKVYQDDVRNHVLMTVKALKMINQNFKIFIFTGRSEKCSTETVKWLEDKCGFYVLNHHDEYDDFRLNVELHMRQENDRRRDSEVKMDMYNQFIKYKYNVFAVFDDRPQVIRECWKVLNVPVFNCGLIDLEF